MPAWNSVIQENFILKKDALGTGLGAWLVQVKDHTDCTYDEAHNNKIIKCIEFTNRSLWGAKTWYRNVEW